MRIGIDARMLSPIVGGGGLGRYVEQLVRELLQLDHKNRYVLFLKKENLHTVPDTCETRLADIHWYTLKEQLLLPRLIDREHLDIIHFPHWNVPLFLKTPFIVTIHDLILLEEPHSAKITTRHPLVFVLKYQVYRFVLRSALKRARTIIAVSQYTKSAILTHFPWVPEDKIHVVHEGVTVFETKSTSTSPGLPLVRGGGIATKDRANSPYFLYVGNAYPHKNLERLLRAYSVFYKQHPEIHLVLAGRGDIFYQRLKEKLNEIDVPNESVTFVLNPSDEEVARLYQGAKLYVFPSRSEGFGLPPLEAMSFNTPVAAARRTSIPEILGDAALYFNPDSTEELVDVMTTAVEHPEILEPLKRAGLKQIKRYSWSRMADEILHIYEK